MMTKAEIDHEIARVKKAIASSKSKHLKNDYSKYLKRLYKQRRECYG